MSYILDALRRADSERERERGAVPSLHTKSMPAGLSDGDEGQSPAASVKRLWWAVGALLFAVIALVGWVMWGRSAPEPAPQVAQAPSSPPMNAGVTPAAPPAWTPPATVVTAPPPATPATSPVEAAPATSPSTPTAPHTTARRGEPAPAPAPQRAVVSKPAPPAPSTRPATAAADNESPVPSVGELPDDIRRQLPALSVSGASYSKNAASRMLILNGQVFREGDTVARDLVLEQIRLKSAVLSYRGTRYSINY